MAHIPPHQPRSFSDHFAFWRLLIQMFFERDQTNTPHVSRHTESVRQFGVWLISASLCVPLLCPTLAVASGSLILFPPMRLGGELEYGLALSLGILVGWLIIGLLGKHDISEMRRPHYLLLGIGGSVLLLNVIVIAFFISMMLCGLAIGSMRDGPTLGIVLSLITSFAFALVFTSVCFVRIERFMGNVGLGMVLSIMLATMLGGILGILFTIILTIPLWKYVIAGSLPGLIIVGFVTTGLITQVMRRKQSSKKHPGSIFRITSFLLSLLGYVEIIWVCFLGGWNRVA